MGHRGAFRLLNSIITRPSRKKAPVRVPFAYGVGDGMLTYFAQARNGKRATLQAKLLCHQALSGFASTLTQKQKPPHKGAVLFFWGG